MVYRASSVRSLAGYCSIALINVLISTSCSVHLAIVVLTMLWNVSISCYLHLLIPTLLLVTLLMTAVQGGAATPENL